jgi:ankyrin repeat protein
VQLCDVGADLSATESSGNTALILATTQKDSVPMVDTLLEAGADPSTTKKDGFYTDASISKPFPSDTAGQGLIDQEQSKIIKVNLNKVETPTC